MKSIMADQSILRGVSSFLSPQVWKQAHQVYQPAQTASRWRLHPLLWTLLTMTWVKGDSVEEKFATARAAYVGCHQSTRRPGKSLAGFLTALNRLPTHVMRCLAVGIRQRLVASLLESVRVNGFLLFGCDASRLECPRSEELQQRLDQAGKPDSAPTMLLTALVLLPLGLLWSWRLGKGTASEQDHLRRLLPTLPEKSLLVCDAGYRGYDFFTAILQAQACFLVRLSSSVRLYMLKELSLKRFREGVVYYWPRRQKDQGLPPLKLRLIRIRGHKADVWLLTNVLDHKQISHKVAAKIYRWRWKNEGLFYLYKRMLGKMKLQSRTVALAHREAEGSLLGLQVLLAVSCQEEEGKIPRSEESPRQVLLRIRGEVQGLLRLLGPRQFAEYQRLLALVRSGECHRTKPKVRQNWPRPRKITAPKAPKIQVMCNATKSRMNKILKGKAA
jgi:hypothetical protein